VSVIMRWLLHILLWLGLWLVTSVVEAVPVYPATVGPAGRHLTDQQGVRFPIAGESSKAVVGDLSVADAEFFFATRQAHGLNTVWINLLCETYTGCNADANTFGDIKPFTVPSELLTPSETRRSICTAGLPKRRRGDARLSHAGGDPNRPEHCRLGAAPLLGTIALTGVGPC